MNNLFKTLFIGATGFIIAIAFLLFNNAKAEVGSEIVYDEDLGTITSQQYCVDVNNCITYSSGNSSISYLSVGVFADIAQMATVNIQDPDGNSKFYIDWLGGTNYIGINTTSPTYPLDIYATTSISVGSLILNSSGVALNADTSSLLFKNNSDATMLRVDENGDVTVTGGLITTGQLFSQTYTDNGSSGIQQAYFHNSASPAADDLIYSMNVQGNDSSGNQTSYGYLSADLLDPADGSEAIAWLLEGMTGGSLVDIFDYNGSEDEFTVYREMVVEPLLTVDSGIYYSTSTSNPIWKSPDGTCWNETIDNSGIFATATTTCP